MAALLQQGSAGNIRTNTMGAFSAGEIEAIVARTGSAFLGERARWRGANRGRFLLNRVGGLVSTRRGTATSNECPT